MKNAYRKFNIRGDDLTPGDDFGMMKEVLTRRFTRLQKEDPDREKGMWPDLLLIDGGAGQVSAVHEIMQAHTGSKTSRWSASPKASTVTTARKSFTASASAPLR